MVAPGTAASAPSVRRSAPALTGGRTAGSNATETATGIGEIATATSELDRTTQQNAAVFEQKNGAVRTLEAEAAGLAGAVAAFRLAPAEGRVRRAA